MRQADLYRYYGVYRPRELHIDLPKVALWSEMGELGEGGLVIGNYMIGGRVLIPGTCLVSVLRSRYTPRRTQRP